MNTPEEQWQELCDEHHATQEAVMKAMSPVIKKQGAIARNESHTNPLEIELNALSEARKRSRDVERRMDEFMERQFGKK